MQTYNYELDLNSVNSNSLIAAQIKRNSEVLEFGPAHGRLTKYMNRELSCTVDIVELDQESAQAAAAYARNVCGGSYFGDIEQYHWEEMSAGKTYDYIIFADVLEHLRKPEKVLAACRKYLKETGSILCSVPNIAHSSIILSLWNDDFPYSDTGLLDRTHVHFYTKKTFLEMAAACGYEPVSIQEIVSRVGGNEIGYSYDMTEDEIETALKFRAGGEVYQYVFRLAGHAAGGNRSRTVNYGSCRGCSCVCYIRQKEDADFRPEKSIIKKYTGRAADLYFSLQSFTDIEGLCVKLIEKSAVIKIDAAQIDQYECPMETNGYRIGENMYIFSNEADLYMHMPAGVLPSILHVKFEVCVIAPQTAQNLVQACIQQNTLLKSREEESRLWKERYEQQEKELQKCGEDLEKARWQAEELLHGYEKCRVQLEQKTEEIKCLEEAAAENFWEKLQKKFERRRMK